jgi:oligopeptide transport system substrate-binding protein
VPPVDQQLRLTGSIEGPQTLDPALVRDTESAMLARQIFRGLVRIGEGLQPVPDLAERIEIAPDRTVYRFVLHDSLTFHDGRAIRAEDVRDSLLRATDPVLETPSAPLPARHYLYDIEGALDRMDGLTDDISGVEVVDDLTVEIRLRGQSVTFLERLTGPPSFVVDAAEASAGGNWWHAPNGSGPFRVAEFVPGDTLILVPHDGYTIRPALEQLIIRYGRGAVGSITQFERGELDLVGIPVSLIERVQYPNSPFADNLVVEPQMTSTMVVMNPNIAPFDQPAVRQAMIQGFERERIATAMLNGFVPAATGVVPHGLSDGVDANLPYPFDPAGAAALMRSVPRSAVTGGVTIYTTGGSIPVAMKRMYEEAGVVNLEVVQLQFSDFLADMLDQRLPMFVVSWGADYPDPTTFLNALFHSESPDNLVGYHNPEVDDVLDRADREPDSSARAALLQQAHQLILDDAIVMPLYYGVDYLLVSTRVQGFELTPLGIQGFESVWISE